MKFFILVGITSIFLGISGQPEAAPFQQEKTYALPSGKKVAVVFRERTCKHDGCREADSGVWGTDGDIPRFIADVFRVSIDGREFLIPEIFYRDLANTRSLNISEQNGQVAVELKGGHAAGAYTARFLLGGMCGFERKVCGEVCREIWEQTIWYNSFAYEDDPLCKSGIQ
jgi:hypothetical protein